MSRVADIRKTITAAKGGRPAPDAGLILRSRHDDDGSFFCAVAADAAAGTAEAGPVMTVAMLGSWHIDGGSFFVALVADAAPGTAETGDGMSLLMAGGVIFFSGAVSELLLSPPRPGEAARKFALSS